MTKPICCLKKRCDSSNKLSYNYENMKNNPLIFFILLLTPQLAFAHGNLAVLWWLALLVVTQIIVIILNFRTDRSMRDLSITTVTSKK